MMTIDIIKKFIHLHLINDYVLRFGVARVINGMSTSTKDVDLYVSHDDFVNLTKRYCDKIRHVPKCHNFDSTYKIVLKFEEYEFEIFLDKDIANIEKYLYNGLYVTTIEQTIADYTNLGEREGKYNVSIQQ